MSQHVIFLMGVSGCGKSTVGQALSKHLSIPFYDGDDFHPEANIQKMKSGHPLNDEDRAGWLQHLHTFVLAEKNKNSCIIACSALKEKYRTVLMTDIQEDCLWVHLSGSYELILSRLQQRENHFMPSNLLQSQFEALEAPQYGLTIDIRLSLNDIIHSIQANIN